MRISDWSSDVCSSDLRALRLGDMDIDQLPARTQVVLARAVQLEQESHRACPDARRAHADVDLFVEQDRNLVIALGPRDVEFVTAVTVPAVVDACRAPIFGDHHVEILEESGRAPGR